MKQFLSRLGGLTLTLVIVLASAPMPTSAQTLLASHTNSGYGRTSSALTRKIRALDDDAVKNLPIPILMGISFANLTRNFGDPRGGGTRSHEGLDIMAPKGAYIVSPTDAVVTGTGTGSNSGKYVYTANPGGERLSYMHLDSIEVKTGDVLKPGDLIGTVGNTGNASGGAPHLHFEIREDGDVTDPYPRLKREFTLTERVAALEDILEDASDEKEEAENIVALHRTSLIAAQAQGITLSKALTEALGTTAGGSLPTPGGSASGAFTRDLTLGSSGEDVRALQALLIVADTGTAADALAAAGATGYFGPVTQRALIEYQTAKDISPATGNFGPLTRAHVAAGK